MSGRFKLNRLIILLLCLLLLGGCVTIYNPATQKKETLLLDTASEVSLGEDMDREISRKFRILSDPKMQARLQDIGNYLSKVSDRQDLIYHFKIIADKELNAFAIPGGFIYVNSGLIQAANDDELAAVLGHEIGHVAARHSVKKLQAVLGYQILLGIALGISKSQDLGQAMDIVFKLTSSGYSRKDELFADKLAVRYLKRTQFNPYGMITFFEKLRREAERQGPQIQLVFLSSHPPLSERIKQASAEIQSPP